MYTFEINAARKDSEFVNGKITKYSPVVEIFSAMARGEELSKFGAKGDEASKYVKGLYQKVLSNDYFAASELNTLRKFAIEPALLKEMQILSFFGRYQSLGYDETPEAEVYRHEGEKSREQAANGDVPFPVITKETYTVPSQTISGGFAVDYRKAAQGDMSKENEGMEQVRISIRNKAVKYCMDKVYASIKGASGVKYTAEGAAIVKATLDAMIQNVNRLGKPVIFGDRAVISQLNAFAGYTDGAAAGAITGISEAAMEEIRRTGLLAWYAGCPVVEIPNQYDFTTVNAAGTNFNTLMPAGLLWVAPTGVNTPIQTWTRGDLTSMTGNDVSTGMLISRFDLEVACDLAKGREYSIGVYKDTDA